MRFPTPFALIIALFFLQSPLAFSHDNKGEGRGHDYYDDDGDGEGHGLGLGHSDHDRDHASNSKGYRSCLLDPTGDAIHDYIGNKLKPGTDIKKLCVREAAREEFAIVTLFTDRPQGKLSPITAPFSGPDSANPYQISFYDFYFLNSQNEGFKGFSWSDPLDSARGRGAKLLVEGYNQDIKDARAGGIDGYLSSGVLRLAELLTFTFAGTSSSDFSWNYGGDLKFSTGNAQSNPDNIKLSFALSRKELGCSCGACSFGVTVNTSERFSIYGDDITSVLDVTLPPLSKQACDRLNGKVSGHSCDDNKNFDNGKNKNQKHAHGRHRHASDRR